MEELSQDDECTVYQNVVQRNEDILWKYRVLVMLLKERRKPAGDVCVGERGVKRNTSTVYNGPRGKLQKSNSH